MIRAASSLRYLHRNAGSNARVLANTSTSFRLTNSNSNENDGYRYSAICPLLPMGRRSFGSSTTNCEEEKLLSETAPAPPSFDETMTKLFLDSDKDVQAVVEAAAPIVWEPTWWPSDQILLLLNMVQEMTGAPLAVTIIGTTVAFRILLFPLFVKAQQNSARMAHMSPELAILKSKLDGKGTNISQEDQVRIGQQMQALFGKYKVNPVTGIIVPLVQMPLFMGMFFGLRNMPDIFPNEMKNGGMLWFTDLSVPDPYYVMPVLAASSFLLSIEVNKDQMLATNIAQGPLLVNVFRFMGIVMIPSISFFSAGLNCYWVTNNSITLLQMLLFKNAAARKVLGIWDLPKPVPGAPAVKSIVETAKEGVSNFVEGKKTLSPSEAMTERNRAIDEQKYRTMAASSFRRRMAAKRTKTKEKK